MYVSMMDAIRQMLIETVQREGSSLLRLSRLLGRNDAYLHQYVHRGSPRRLPERERAILADFLGLSQEALGGPAGTGGVPIRRLDVVASAGPGALGDDDRLASIERFPAPMLRRLVPDPATLSMIIARGDSMSPTIADGDDILVDTADRRVGVRPAIFVLRIDAALVVKRLRREDQMVIVASDNPAAAPIAPIAVAEVDVVGRVVWLGRTLG